ncbi:hypothetical protein HK104_002788 [Borealophlyctis nickersoniae]|nr:hypothetical protein HK104_002788 [Borealophlyctis nickersoniae]
MTSNDVHPTNGHAVKAAPKREYLTPRDNMFLVLEDDFHFMNVHSVYTFDRPVPFSDMRNQMLQFADTTPRCKQKLVYGKSLFARPYWVEDESYNIDDHFLKIDLPSPGSEEQLREVAGKLISHPLEMEKPLWRVYYISGLDHGRKCALLLTAHHCMADGQGFVRRILAFVSGDTTEEERAALQYSAGRNARAAAAAQQKQSTPLAVARQFAIAFMSLIYGLLLYLVNLVRFMSAVNRHGFARRPEKFGKRSPKTSKKQVGWSTTVRLDDVKKIKNKFGVTVNDVLTSCVATAMDAHLTNKKAERDSTLWLLVPTSMRRPDDWSVSNQTSGYFLRVPVGNATMLDRIKAVNKAMKNVKGSLEAVANFMWIEILYNFPRMIPKWGLLLSRNFHGVLSNVPGPAVKMMWASDPIAQVVSFIPQAYPNTVSTTVYTYAGHVAVSFLMDLVEDGEGDPCGVYAPGAAAEVAKEFERVFGEVLEFVESGAAEVDGNGHANGKVEDKKEI